MTTCFKYHLCLKFAHVGNIVFQFRNVSHNHIGGYFNISDGFSVVSTLDLSYNNISGDISTLIFCLQDNNTTDNDTTYGPLCYLQTL